MGGKQFSKCLQEVMKRLNLEKKIRRYRIGLDIKEKRVGMGTQTLMLLFEIMAVSYRMHETIDSKQREQNLRTKGHSGHIK